MPFKNATIQRHHLPGLVTFLGALLLSLVLIKPEIPLNDQATGRHLAMGRTICESGELPQTDPLSFTYSDRPYLDFEWLFDVSSYLISEQVGLAFLVYLTFLVYSTGILLFAFHLIRQKIQVFTCLSFCFLLAFANYIHLLTRPVIFTYFFLIIIIILWNNWLKRIKPYSSLIGMLIIFALWANIHPGFASGLVYLGLSSLGYFIDHHKQAWTSLKTPLLRIILVGSLCGLVTLM